MKKALFAVLCMLVAIGNANADESLTVGVNVDWGTGDTGTVATAGFAIGDAASIDSIDVEISHTWAGDVEISLTSAVNGETLFAVDNVGGNDDIGIAGTGVAGDEALYSFAFNGTNTGFDASGDGFLGGDANGGALSASAGPYLADIWTLTVADTVGGDGGAIANVTVNYTAAIPEPATGLVILGLAGIAGIRRRR